MTTKQANFQAESKKSGDTFESKVYKLIKNEASITSIQKDYKIEGIGVEVDFFVESTILNKYIECKGGNSGPGKRPGAKRTDNVKKAIANGALLKATNPDAYYIVYFSSKPVPNTSAEEMINTALLVGFLDEVHYL